MKFPVNFKASFLYASRLIFPKTGKKSNARRSLIAAAFCIGMSVVPMEVVLTVANGMIDGITERLVTLSSSHLRATLFRNDGKYDFATKNEEEFKILAEKIENLDGVKSAFCEVDGIGLASGLKGRSGVTIRCIDEKVFREGSKFRNLFNVIEGNFSFDDFQGAEEKSDAGAKFVFIGEKLAKNLELHSGDDFRLITSRTLSNGKILPKITKMKVAAIISSGYQELDALWLFLPLKEGFSIFAGGSGSYHIGIETENPYSYALAMTQSKVQNLLINADNGAGRFYVQKWTEMNSAEYENFSSTRLMLILVMVLIVLVASVNIASSLVMLTIERRKEIAILKSMGAGSGEIAFSFMTAGFFTGFLGVAFGVPLGLIISLNFNEIIHFAERSISCILKFFGSKNDFVLLDPAFYLQNLSIIIPWGQIGMIVLGVLLLSLIVSFFPSLKAGKEKPAFILAS